MKSTKIIQKKLIQKKTIMEANKKQRSKTGSLPRIKQPDPEREHFLRGVVEEFDNAKRRGVIRYEDHLYKINLTDISQEACILPVNETVSFELKQTETGVALTNVQTTTPRLRGKIIALGSETGKIKGTDGRTYFFSFDEIWHQQRKLRMLDMVEFACQREEKSYSAIKIICDNGFALHRFCGEPTDNFYKNLATKAAPENWNYLNMDFFIPFPILRSYFIHTFEHAMEQGLIAYSYHDINKRAIAYLNTGLLTAEGEEIYAIFSKVCDQANYNTPVNWQLNNCTDKWSRFLHYCDRAPLAPRYYYTLNQITFDSNLPIVINENQIMKRCSNVLPPLFFSGDNNFLAQSIKDAVEDSLDYFRKGLVKPVLKYYQNQLEFVLPFYLNGKISLAITLELHNDSYCIKTLQPLDIAYKCARAIAPITEEWLKPICFFEKVDWMLV